MTKMSFLRLLTENFEETYRFYKDTLGFDEMHVNKDMEYAEFDISGTKLALFNRNKMASALGVENKSKIHECADKQVIVLQVEDVDGLYKDLKGKGVIFLSEPEDRPEWTVRTAHLRDPEGNILEFNTPLSDI